MCTHGRSKSSSTRIQLLKMYRSSVFRIRRYILPSPPLVPQVQFITNALFARQYGEQVCAWIKKKDNLSAQVVTASDIKTFCKDKIAHYKVPHYILFKDSFPMTVTGKYMKHKMREQTIEELQLQKEIMDTA